MCVKKSFGKKLEAARNNIRCTREDLAKKIGINARTIQFWEDGKHFPSDLSILPKLSDALGVDVIKLLGEAVNEIQLS